METILQTVQTILSAEQNNNDSSLDINGKDIMFYDGVCKYCYGTVTAAIKNDPDGKFLYSPLQSIFAQQVLSNYGINSLELKSVYIVSEYNTSNEHLRNGAPGANYLLSNLSGELKAFGEANSRKPREVQDMEYKDISDNRYARHGKFDEVFIPKEHREKFIF